MAAEAPPRAASRPPAPPAIRLALGWLALVLLVACCADLMAPYGYAEQFLLHRLQPPAFAGGEAAFWLGTDHLGRDVLSRLVHAVRISVAVALLGTLIGAVIGSLIGVVAAHFRGFVEEALMGLVDVQASLPFIIFALTVVAFFGNNLARFVLLLGFAGWERYARLVRGLVVDAATHGYAEAVRNLGGGPLRVYGRHVLPNVLGALLVQMTLNFPETILLETGLSFLGLGIQPPLTSLGLMLNDARNYVALYWWLWLAPGAVIFLTSLAVSLVGDWLRDRVDASLR